jgi:hypothetical protein
MTFNEDPTRAPQIESFPLSDADKQYQFLSEETAKQIMVGHRVVSPLIHGIREANGFGSNKDEMLVGLEIFNNQVIKPYQRIIERVFTPILGEINIEMNSPFDKEVLVVEQTIQTAELKKKVVADANNDFSDEQGRVWIDTLKEKGEVVDLNDWELISEEEVTEPENEQNFRQEYMSIRDYANADERSPFGDTGLYKLRYAYSQNLSENSREFCQEMVDLSQSGLSFRFEDIQDMSDAGINGQFAPEGSSTYNIFIWKGGAFCHHFWKRQIYIRKRDAKGRVLPNDGLNNDKRVGNNPFVPQKGAEGVAPINTPSRGSIKYS